MFGSMTGSTSTGLQETNCRSCNYCKLLLYMYFPIFQAAHNIKISCELLPVIVSSCLSIPISCGHAQTLAGNAAEAGSV